MPLVPFTFAVLLEFAGYSLRNQIEMFQALPEETQQSLMFNDHRLGTIAFPNNQCPSEKTINTALEFADQQLMIGNGCEYFQDNLTGCSHNDFDHLEANLQFLSAIHNGLERAVTDCGVTVNLKKLIVWTHTQGAVATNLRGGFPSFDDAESIRNTRKKHYVQIMDQRAVRSDEIHE